MAVPDTMTDDEIRAILKSDGQPMIPINPFTRPLLLRKAQEKTRGAEVTVQESSPVNSPVNSPVSVKSDRLYVMIEGAESVYLCGEASVKSMKPGARFRKFETEAEARGYLEELKSTIGKGGLSSTGNSADPAHEEKANAFPRLKIPDLNRFRKYVEDDDVDAFANAVWENPRYLITQVDTPEILKQSVHYNALHCAAKSGCLKICKMLFEILRSERYWSLVYPNDPIAIRNKRQSHLLDHYLNMCDKGLQETPLHFACKNGHADIVTYLLTFQACDTQAKNVHGETPYDVASRNPSTKQKICDLLSEPVKYYVPVLRAIDNSTPPSLVKPRTLQELENLPNPILDSPIINSALAGPMSPLQARLFYKEWHSPSNGADRKEARNVKRGDPDRGMERVGRQIARQRNVSWKEYWEFLDCACDLSKPEGLQALESHLSSVYSLPSRELMSVSETSPRPPLRGADSPLCTSNGAPVGGGQDMDDNTASDTGSNTGSDTSSNTGSDTGSNTGTDTSSNTGSDTGSSDRELAELLDSKLSIGNSITPKSSTRINNGLFLVGSEPSKLDLDVMIAINDLDISPSTYPNIIHWRSLVSSYTEEQKQRWKTPSKLSVRKITCNEKLPPFVLDF